MNDGGHGLSLYKAGKLSPEIIVQSQLRLHAVFPRMGEDFFNLLTERLIENNFSDQKLTDATNHLIDNFQYKELNIADILRFDRAKKIYTYSEFCDEISRGLARGDDFEMIEIENKNYWIKTADKYQTYKN